MLCMQESGSLILASPVVAAGAMIKLRTLLYGHPSFRTHTKNAIYYLPILSNKLANKPAIRPLNPLKQLSAQPLKLL